VIDCWVLRVLNPNNLYRAGRASTHTDLRPLLRPSRLPAAAEEAAPRQASCLKHENTDSHVDSPHPGCISGEGEARIDASGYEQHRPANRRRWNHDAPPSAEYEAHEYQRWNHGLSVLRDRRKRGFGLAAIFVSTIRVSSG
jgi:hypothetical protein